MAGQGYPFPYLQFERPRNVAAMMPWEVSDLDRATCASCQAMLATCEQAARLRAVQQNDPKYTQYADWFKGFANNDASARFVSPSGQQAVLYNGGCKLLMSAPPCPSGRFELWNSRKEALTRQLTRFHMDLPYSDN